MGIELLLLWFLFWYVVTFIQSQNFFTKTRQNKPASVTRIWQCAMAKQIIEHMSCTQNSSAYAHNYELQLK